MSTVSAAGENWLLGWNKRAAITITSSAALTNYQVSITVAYDSDMQADFDDLRFTTSDGSTLMDYWLESKTDSSIAKVWVEVPSLVASTNTIYMYYNNTSATSASNGTNTFVVFDDFNDGVINTSLWETRNGGGWTIAESGGELNTVADSNWGWAAVRTITNFTRENYRFVTNVRYQEPGSYGPRTAQNVYDKAVTHNFTTDYYGECQKDCVSFTMHGHAGTGQWDAKSFSMRKRNSSSAETYDMSAVNQFAVGNMIRMDGKFNFTANTSITDFYVNGVFKQSRSMAFSDVSISTVTFELHGYYFSPVSNSHWDYAFVAKYTATEPTASVGTEEVLTAPVLAQVTAVSTPTADTTPSYTFSSTKVGTITYSGNCSGATISAIAGNNTITFNALTSGTYGDCKIRVIDSYGNQSNLLSVNTFVIDAVAPTLTQVTAVPTPTVYIKPSYTFSSNENGTITYAGDCSSATTSAIAGNNTITFNTLAVGTHSNCTIVVTDSLGNASSSLAVNSFTINSYSSATSISANLSCFVTSGTCSGTTVFKLYDYLGGHAELSSQSNYLFKVCCTGTGISNSCSGNYGTVLKLSGATNAHAEKNNQSNYSGSNVCLHSDSMSVFCDYNTSCSAIGSDFVCLASISDNTNAHIGDCSSPYTNKVCCRIGAIISDCSVKVASSKSIALKNIDIQLCSGADINNTSDPCYSVCWKGIGTPNLASSDWKCSVCYNSSNNPISCSTAVSTTIEWVMPTGYVTPTDYTLVSGTLTSANPIVRFTAQDDDRIINLNINSYGTSCSGQNSGQFVPTWREISPF
ncbi:MAG: DUF2341 domain-containing protein [Bacteroidales bacterium]|nr:DUF2341 domain-containing protein [Bacteroidales bacterium]